MSFSRTSAAAVGLRASLPLKITSSIRSPRRLLALCSPSTHVMASTTLLLPQPFGPTMAVTPSSNPSSARSGKLLKPVMCSRERRMHDALVHKNSRSVGEDTWAIDPQAAGNTALGHRRGATRSWRFHRAHARRLQMSAEMSTDLARSV